MRILVLSDIHANLSALDAVLADAGSIDSVWCLGDVVGYGPDPNECVSRLRELPSLACLVGNHDAAALGHIDLDSFNREARTSTRWTQTVLTEESRTFLAGLPERQEIDDVTMAHGSPRNPVWEYLLDLYSAFENFSQFTTSICLVGHTHIPLAFTHIEGAGKVRWQILQAGESIDLNERMILNPGSVGQPRDHDPRAAYAIYNSETRQWRACRVKYDVSAVQERMRQSNLPSRLVQRIAEGW
jgi:diadenosine tetraphosphatase ApaH/serine/threonine PP2A family protein phosphatase